MSEKIPAPSKRPIQEHLSEMDDELLKKYKLEFLGEGGEQIVFGVKDHSDVVAKAHKQMLSIVVKKHLDKGVAPDVTDLETALLAKRYIAQQKEHYRVFKKHFGKAALKERVLFMPVPFPVDHLDDDVRGAYQKAYPNASYGKASTLVRFQERVATDGVIDNMAVSPFGAYLETEDLMTPNEYRRINKLITGATIDDAATADVVGGRALLKNDGKLRECVADFVSKAMAYTLETGQTLDLVGEGNIIFIQNDGEWEYKLPDALYPGFGNKIFLESQKLLQKMKQGETISDDDRGDLMNGLAYVRQINALAQLSGVKDRLVLADELSASDHDRIFNAITSK